MLGSWVRIPTSAFHFLGPTLSLLGGTPMSQHSRLLLGLMFFVACAFPSSGQEPAKKFRAAAYAQDITPQKFPISVNGGMSDRQATAAHDRLHARCLVLDDG